MTKHWKRCLIHLIWIFFCVAILYAVNDFPYLFRSQAIHYTLARNLTTQYQPLETFSSNNQYHEQVHLYQCGDDMATFRTSLWTGGLFPRWNSTPWISYPSQDGLTIIPLYEDGWEDGKPTTLHLAVTCFDPRVDTVTLVATQEDGTTKTIPTKMEKPGLFLATFPNEWDITVAYYDFPLYNNNDTFSAIAYNYKGEIIAQKSQIWSDHT